MAHAQSLSVSETSLPIPGPERPSGTYCITAELIFVPEKSQLKIDTDVVQLTVTELKLVMYLADRAGTWVPSEELLTAVLGRPPREDYALIRVHLCNIRRKLGRHATRLVSRRNVGIMLRSA
jgi:DNA-binding response OmpR family regulator